MIELLDVCYVRMGTKDIQTSTDFATRILGLEVSESSRNSRHLRSDERGHTLYYHEGDPNDHVVGFEVRDSQTLEITAATLEDLGHDLHRGTRDECDSRHVRDFVAFREPSGLKIELVVQPEIMGKRHFPSRDAGISGFSHVGIFSQDCKRDEAFWTQVCNARVSDRIGDVPLLRVNEIHHTLALVPAGRGGLQHINHQVESTDDIMRSYNLLKQHNVPITFGPGRHPTSGARFVYFQGPDGMTFEYSVGVNKVDEETYRERQFGFEPFSLCMWGAKSNLNGLEN
jgi:2,3-dihydroxy-p-cumate/2,3-dihydroxybenzoate 3,4-dioxygenase